MYRILLATCLLCISLATHAAMYKWVDENGVTQFSQYPPKDQQAERLRPPPPPAEDPAAAKARLQKQIDGFDNRRLTEETDQEEQAKQAAEAAQRKRRCEAARHNLESLQLGGGRRIQTETGEVIRPTDAQREERMQAARKIIEEDCQ